MIGTGLLIGMGAPFWFDLAVRLSQVRSMLRGKPATGESYDGASPPPSEDDGGEDKALPLIKRVVDEAISAAVESHPRKLLVEKREI